MCVAFDFAEVPCDIRNDVNCIWKIGDQCCDKTDWTKTGKGDINQTWPIRCTRVCFQLDRERPR